MMLGNGADCDGCRGDGVAGCDGSEGVLRVAVIGVAGWIVFEIVAPTGGGVWDRTEVALGGNGRKETLERCYGWSSVEGEECPAF